MIEKYKDSLIKKKRGYNMSFSSLRRTTTLGLPVVAAVVITGEIVQHQTTIQAILETNRLVFKEYQRTNDKKVLEKLQKIPTNSITTRIHDLSVSLREGIVSWKSGSRTKD